MYQHGKFYRDLGEREATEANRLVALRHGHPLPLGALLPCVQLLGELIVGGTAPKDAVAKVIREEFPQRQKAGMRRKEQYEEALREAIWVRYDFVVAYMNSRGNNAPPPPPFEKRVIVRSLQRQRQRELALA